MRCDRHVGGAEVTDRMTFAANRILQYMLSKTIFRLVMVKVFDLNGNCGKGLRLGLFHAHNS